MRSAINFLGAFLIVTLAVLAAQGQEHTYSSPKAEYLVDFPSPTWRLVDEPDDVHRITEFVYGDRSDGYLRVRKENLEPNMTIQEFARRDQDRTFLPGFIDGKQETFDGRLNGVTSSYEFTTSGKSMAGRTYYLRGEGTTVYVLRFTGFRDKLIRIRNQTDAIARSFRSK